MAIHIAAYALKLGCFFTFDIVTPLVTLQHPKLYKPCVVLLRLTAFSNLTGGSLPAFSSLFNTIILATRCKLLDVAGYFDKFLSF